MLVQLSAVLSMSCMSSLLLGTWSATQLCSHASSGCLRGVQPPPEWSSSHRREVRS